jgi:phosphoglycerate dehydrogenase-like enzyme
MAKRAQAFELKVLAYDPYVSPEVMARHGVESRSLDDLLRESDFISAHVPHNRETHHLLSEAQFNLMKPTAIFVNTGRGRVVDEPALIRALQAGKLAGAGLDVFEHEPPGDNPLLKLEQVVVTPHAAGVDLQSRDDMALSAAQAIVSLSKGEWPAEKIVNPEVKSRFRW